LCFHRKLIINGKILYRQIGQRKGMINLEFPPSIFYLIDNKHIKSEGKIFTLDQKNTFDLVMPILPPFIKSLS